MKRTAGLLSFLLCACGTVALADTITFGGSITQPNANPPAGNASLDLINLNDLYSVTLDFAAPIAGTGTYTNFTGVAFNDLTVAASETAFDLSNVSLSIAADSNTSYYDFSLLACLTTGSGCYTGNQLAANFKILAADLNAASAVAQSIPSLTPLDLLEDGGLTDIQGTVTSYSYTAADSNNVPEPAWSFPILLGFAAILTKVMHRIQRPASMD